MDDDAFEVVALTREAAHQAVSRGYAHAQALLLNGKRVRIRIAEDVETVTLKQHKFFHGPVLQQIAEQARVNGERFTVELWRRHLKNVILERKPRYDMVKLPGQKRATPRRRYWSLTELGVKRMSEFIDEAIAIAAGEWGVVFHFLIDEREGVRYVAPRRRKEQQQPEEAEA